MEKFVELARPVLPVTSGSVFKMDQRALHILAGRHGPESETWKTSTHLELRLRQDTWRRISNIQLRHVSAE